MDSPSPSDSAYFLSVAAIGIASLLVLIVRLKMHAFLALVLVSLLTAAATGMRADRIVPTMIESFGSTLAPVALLVAFGAMIGRMLEYSGGAKVLADALIDRFGTERAPLALGVASLLFGFPMFFDAGLIVMMPIILSVGHRLGGSVLKYALPAAGAFAVMHAFAPPHPGPVAAGEILSANIGLLALTGIAIAVPTWYAGSYLFGLWCGKRFDLPVPTFFGGQDGRDDRKPPSFRLVLWILLMPLALIFLETGLATLSAAGAIPGDAAWVWTVRTVGKTPVALLITVLFCLVVFTRRYGSEVVERLCGDCLGPICVVILVTGAGGMFGGVLRASGVGSALSGVVFETGLPLIVSAFLIAAVLRVAQGSATVALTTTAALIAPMMSGPDVSSALDKCFIVIAIAGGATVLSHFNDSGFWLVGRCFGMDERTTLRTWTVMVTLLGSIAFTLAWLGSALW